LLIGPNGRDLMSYLPFAYLDFSELLRPVVTGSGLFNRQHVSNI